MISRLCLLNFVLFCVLQDGGFVVTDGPTVPAFVITARQEPTPVPEPAKPEVQEKPKEDAASEVKPRFFFRFFTADWCFSCRKFKTTGRLKELQDVAEVEVIDIDKDKSFSGISTIPRVRLYDRETGKHVSEWIGDQSTAAMKSKYVEKISSLSKVAAREPSLFGRKGTSHESRETLIKHLLDDGIHRGLHTRTDLERLSDRELTDLHDQEHRKAGDVVVNGLWRKK